MNQSKRTNKIAFYIIISFTFVISVIDNLLTYIGSPDLAKESNPLLRLRASIEWCMYLFDSELFDRYCDTLGRFAITTVWGRGDMIIAVVVLIVVLMTVYTHKIYKANQKLINLK